MSRPDLVRVSVLCVTAHKIGTTDSWNNRITAVRKALPMPTTATSRRGNLGRIIATCAAVRDPDFTEAARKIAVLTICIVGDQDGATPPDLVKSLAQLIPCARLEVIRDTSRIPCVEQPEALTAVIRVFIDFGLHGEKNHEPTVASLRSKSARRV